MTAPYIVDVAAVLRQQVTDGRLDVLRTMVTAFANALMSADAICSADYGQRSEERSNRRNGYRTAEWDIRAADPSPPRRAGPGHRGSHQLPAGGVDRQVEKLAEQLGVTRLSKSQVSERPHIWMPGWRRFAGGRWIPGITTFVSLDALTMKVREDGGTVNVACLVAVGANADGTGKSLAWIWFPMRTTLADVPALADGSWAQRSQVDHLRRASWSGRRPGSNVTRLRCRLRLNRTHRLHRPCHHHLDQSRTTVRSHRTSRLNRTTKSTRIGTACR
jgi:hypothetical protein